MIYDPDEVERALHNAKVLGAALERERARADRAEAALDEIARISMDDPAELVDELRSLALVALSAGSSLSLASKVAACGCSFRPGATATCPHGNTLAALSAGSGGRETRPEGHEGMVTVYDHKGGYLGCMGRETWEKAVADEAQRRKTSP